MQLSPSLKRARDDQGSPRSASSPQCATYDKPRAKAPQKPKRALVTRASAKDVHRWAYLYTVIGPKGNPVYIGQTVSEKKRAAAHESSASKCTELRDFIMRCRHTFPGWKFADNFKRVTQLAYGAPAGDVIDMYECYFIQRMEPLRGGSTRGTLCTDANDEGCNIHNGPNFTKHKHRFEEIEGKLRDLEPGQCLHSAEEEGRAKMTSMDVARSDHGVLKHILEITRDDEGAALPEVEERFNITVSQLEVLTNVQETKEKVQKISALASQAVKSECTVTAETLAKLFNDLKGSLHDYVPDVPHSAQAFAHAALCADLKTCAVQIGNGDRNGTDTVSYTHLRAHET